MTSSNLPLIDMDDTLVEICSDLRALVDNLRATASPEFFGTPRDARITDWYMLMLLTSTYCCYHGFRPGDTSNNHHQIDLQYVRHNGGSLLEWCYALYNNQCDWWQSSTPLFGMLTVNKLTISDYLCDQLYNNRDTMDAAVGVWWVGATDWKDVYHATNPVLRAIYSAVYSAPPPSFVRAVHRHVNHPHRQSHANDFDTLDDYATYFPFCLVSDNRSRYDAFEPALLDVIINAQPLIERLRTHTLNNTTLQSIYWI